MFQSKPITTTILLQESTIDAKQDDAGRFYSRPQCPIVALAFPKPNTAALSGTDFVGRLLLSQAGRLVALNTWVVAGEEHGLPNGGRRSAPNWHALPFQFQILSKTVDRLKDEARLLHSIAFGTRRAERRYDEGAGS